MKKNVCKICRRLGQKLFLKGEKCSSPKCAMIKRAFAPGQKKKKGQGKWPKFEMKFFSRHLDPWLNWLNDRQVCFCA